MKVAALEFRVADRYFAIEMSKVKHFFEVENIKKLDFLPHFVEGIVNYNNYVYPLISLKKAWDINDETKEDIAVAIVCKNREYAILIDEIIRIDKFDKKENFLVDVFEGNGKLIGTLDLTFLNDPRIPTFINKAEKYEEEKNTDMESFLLFKCNDEILAIDVSLIKKIENYEKDTIIINGMVLNLISSGKIYKECEKTNVLVLENKKTMAFVIGEVIDICLIDKNEITNSFEGIFNRYFLYKNKEVRVFSVNYLNKLIKKYGAVIKKDNVKNFDEKIEVLLLNICGEKFAIRMKKIVDITEYDEASLNFANNNPHVKGIITTREGATCVLSFEKILKKEPKISEDSKIVVIKDNKHFKSLLVDSIDDIIYVKNENIMISKKSKNIVGGMVISEKGMFPLININWPKDL